LSVGEEPPRVFVTRELPGTGIEALRRIAEVEVWPEEDPPPSEMLRRKVPQCAGLLTMITDRVDDALLEAAPQLRIVSQMAVGYDNIDVAACTRRGVVVTNTPGVLTETTADLAFALILGWSRRLIEGERIVREGRWGQWHPTSFLGRDVNGATLGIVGLGAIGQAVARRARGFGMRVLYSSRSPKPEVEHELGVEWRALSELLTESDFVSLHVALTPETRGLIGARELALMKPGAALVNTARGAVVDQAALVRALSDGRLGGAALDVFEREPLSPDDPLLRLPNVLVAPHVGSATVETRTRMADLAFENLRAFFAGERPPCLVNAEVLSSG
jgi:glyoxylate reductase